MKHLPSIVAATAATAALAASAALAAATVTAAAAPVPTAAPAARPPIIDRSLFFGEIAIAGAQISPDGKFISFLKPYQGTRNIWVKGADEPFSAARPLSHETSRPIRSYFWSRDSKYLLYAQDSGGDETFNMVTAMEQFFARYLGGRQQEDVPADVAAKLKEITVDPKTVSGAVTRKGASAPKG